MQALCEMKLLITLFLISYSTILGAEKSHSYWQAIALENSCIAKLDMTNIGSAEPLYGVFIVFYIPNADFNSYPVNLLKENDPRLLLSIQPLVDFTKLDKGIIASKVTVETEMKIYDIPIDKMKEHSDFQSFLLPGTHAQEIWEQIVAKQVVSIKVYFSTGKHYSFSIEGKRIDRVSRMLAVCAD